MEIGPCPGCGRKIREQGAHPRFCKHCRSRQEDIRIRKEMTSKRFERQEEETNMPRKPVNKNYVCSKVYGGCGAKFQNSPDRCPKCDRRMPLFKGIE